MLEGELSVSEDGVAAMKINQDKRTLEAYRRWEDAACDIARHGVEITTLHCPEMTPIEQLVFFALMEAAENNLWTVLPQEQIGKYRADFLVKPVYINRNDPCAQVVVECDGHDFHEKTKEQAQKDKQRDRHLQSLGFKVYRFTGSEIWKSSGQCVPDALGARR